MRSTLELLKSLRERLNTHGWIEEGMCCHIIIMQGMGGYPVSASILTPEEGNRLLAYIMARIPTELNYLQEYADQRLDNRSEYYWWDIDDVKSRKEFLDMLIKEYEPL